MSVVGVDGGSGGMAEAAARIARAEGFTAHARAAELRRREGAEQR